jgi:hypothetical protein
VRVFEKKTIKNISAKMKTAYTHLDGPEFKKHNKHNTQPKKHKRPLQTKDIRNKRQHTLAHTFKKKRYLKTSRRRDTNMNSPITSPAFLETKVF